MLAHLKASRSCFATNRAVPLCRVAYCAGGGHIGRSPGVERLRRAGEANIILLPSPFGTSWGKCGPPRDGLLARASWQSKLPLPKSVFRSKNSPESRVVDPSYLAPPPVSRRKLLAIMIFPMKMIFLNTWNGRIRQGIAAFIQQQIPGTDVFCFQEVYKEMQTLCRGLLPNYRMIRGYKKVAEDDDFLQATYLRNDLQLLSWQLVLKKHPGTGLGIYTQIDMRNNMIHLCNLHGTARPGTKLDTPQRINQSQELLDFFKEKKGLKIIGGDFNLGPETKSVQMFEENGYRNLIREFGIRTTRNRLAWEPYSDDKQYYSDYVFVSPEVKVKEFSVPENEISDHLALVLRLE